MRQKPAAEHNGERNQPRDSEWQHSNTSSGSCCGNVADGLERIGQTRAADNGRSRTNDDCQQ